MSELIECARCKHPRPLEAFPLTKLKSKRPSNTCEHCWGNGNQRDPKVDRERWLRWKYGITSVEYDALYILQGGKCAICNVIPTKPLVVDHCHATHKVRGLLCSECNKGLGFLKDSVELLGCAIKYLEQG